MKITYDKFADAVYIQLAESIAPGGVANVYLCDPDQMGGIVNIDLDEAGQIIGLEILTASSMLPKNVLDEADGIGDGAVSETKLSGSS
ncbi:DUF2283 domain-containing protein [Subtercola endophyticus]|uniref:DUF2283 domain-containing protein n=1 Tax=Subtercola endophyticus TaxID=2895559 RepID=UPI001E64A3A7|nr:DUF2283 domain-containing protein [Subtercola endophyticus]UFS59090.1 DUF2283 domain-containing protein [Subtercola endophyticus]